MLIWIVFRAADQTGTVPSAAEYGIVVFFSSVLNILGGAGFTRIGHANPSHARSAVRRLITIGQNINQARAILGEQSVIGDGSDHLGAAAAILQATEPHLENAISDWNEVHPEALSEVLAGRKEEGV